jgi:hypothetical protein
MAIKIQRKPGTNVTWIVDGTVNSAFPDGEDVFTIPSLNDMLYLHKYFTLIEATDENGNDLDLTDICNCCRESIRLELISAYNKIKNKEVEVGDF